MCFCNKQSFCLSKTLLQLGLQAVLICRKIKPTRPRGEPTWSLPEGLATGAIRGPDHAYPMRGNQAISTDPTQPGSWEKGIKGSPRC